MLTSEQISLWGFPSADAPTRSLNPRSVYVLCAFGDESSDEKSSVFLLWRLFLEVMTSGMRSASCGLRALAGRFFMQRIVNLGMETIAAFHEKSG